MQDPAHPPSGTFRLHAGSRILTPDVPGLRALLTCLRGGLPVQAALPPQAPVTGGAGPVQRLSCQTSGSSGQPKTIRRTPASWTASFETNKGLFGITDADTYAVLGHLGTSLPLYGAMEALHLGADLAALPEVPPRRQLALLAELSVSVLYATPTQLKLLAAAGGGAALLDGLRLILSGGGKLDRAARQAVQRLCPAADVVEFFGASETSFITLAGRDAPEGSVGRPYPGVRLRIGSGEGSGPFTTGEIWVASPYLFEGYEHGGSGSVQRDGGFLSIGEMGYTDAEGNLFLRGRKNRMFTVADRNVFPEEIEAVVAAVPGVRGCAVVPQPDALRGNAAICFVAADKPLREAVQAACRAGLDRSAMPRAFRFLEDLPLLPAGKPDLVELQRML